MRRISLEISVDITTDRHALKRLNARLDFIAEIIRQYAGDENRQSLLKEVQLHIKHWDYAAATCHHGHTYCHHHKKIQSLMFCLETLIPLREAGIEKVQVTGIDPWFAECMGLYLGGEGGELKKMEWPVVKGRRRAGPGWDSNRWIPTVYVRRQWWQPVFDWEEFARRNGVGLPEDTGEMFVVGAKDWRL